MQNNISVINYITVKKYLNELLLKKIKIAFEMQIKGKTHREDLITTEPELN